MKSENYSGFWVRFFANFIDGIIMALVYVPIAIVTGIIVGILSIGSGGENLIIIVPFIMSFIQIVISLSYIILMPASKYQGTVGKKLMGIKIVDEAGERISLGKSGLRYLGMIVSGLIFYIGYIMVAFHPQKRGLHDVIAKTYVVSAK